MDRNTIVLLCVGAYMAFCVAIGLWAMRRTKSTHDFFMAGRNLGVVVTGVAIFSSTMSGFGFVGGPGLIYRMGTSSLWMIITSPVGFGLAYFLLAKRVRLIAELRRCISLPDVAAARYGSSSVRMLVAAAILGGVIPYLATQIKAMALVLQEIFVSNNISELDSLLACVVISSAVLVFYCVTGGIIASVYTDLFQGIVMVVVALLVFVSALGTVDGGLHEIANVIATDNSEAASPWGTIGILGCLSWFLMFSLGVTGQPHLVTKMMMSRSVDDARRSLPITLVGFGLTALLWISIGLVMRTLVISGLNPPHDRADDAAFAFLNNYAHPVLAGLAFAGLFAAVMSTADGFLNIGAAALVHDIPRAITGRPLKNELLMARIATVALAVFAATCAMVSPDLVGILGAYGWGVFSAALVPAIGFGLNWKQATPLAAVLSILVSLVINAAAFVLQLTDIHIPYGVSPGAIALLASMLVFFGVSLVSKPPRLAEDIDAVMDI